MTEQEILKAKSELYHDIFWGLLYPKLGRVASELEDGKVSSSAIANLAEVYFDAFAKAEKFERGILTDGHRHFGVEIEGETVIINGDPNMPDEDKLRIARIISEAARLEASKGG